MTKHMVFDFDPLERAESMMAKVAALGADGFKEALNIREEARDLMLLSIAKSLAVLAQKATV